MSQTLQLARPMMGSRTSLDPDQARRQQEELQYLPSPVLAPDQHRTFSINAVDLKDGFGAIQTDSGDLAHELLLCRSLQSAARLPHQNVGILASPAVALGRD